MQGITPGIVRLWHFRIVSKACQGPASVPGLYEKRAWKQGFRTDGRQPLPNLVTSELPVIRVVNSPNDAWDQMTLSFSNS